MFDPREDGDLRALAFDCVFAYDGKTWLKYHVTSLKDVKSRCTDFMALVSFNMMCLNPVYKLTF